MRSLVDSILTSLIRLLHEKLGCSPTAVSFIGLGAGMFAAVLVAGGFLGAGMIALALSQILDALDGGVARRYHLASERGKRIETYIDRANEGMIFLALAYSGQASYLIALLALSAILLVTMIEPYSHFDPGFKRFMLYFGFFATEVYAVKGFDMALHVVFLANLSVFAIGTVIADYRLQSEVDRQAMIRLAREGELGMPALPPDPPSFLSRLFG